MPEQSQSPLHLFTSDRQIVARATSASLDDVLFASVKSPEQAAKEFLRRSGLHAMEISFGDSPLFVLSPWKFYQKIKKAISPTSGAYYLLWHEEKNENPRYGFLVQYLPPHAATSRHYHLEQTEIFNVLEGELSLETSEGTFPLSFGDSYTVKPNVMHQLQTQEAPSLTILEIKNVNYKDHHLVE